MSHTVPRTELATWAQLPRMSTSPADFLANHLGDYAHDYDDNLLGSFLAAVNDHLPAGLILHVDGSVTGEVTGPISDRGTAVAAVLDAIDCVALDALAEKHDVAGKVNAVLVYLVDAETQTRAELPLITGLVDDRETASQLLASLDASVEANALYVDPGTPVDVVAVAADGTELRSARAVAE